MSATEKEIYLEAPVGGTISPKKIMELVFYGDDKTTWMSSTSTQSGGVWLFVEPTAGVGEVPITIKAANTSSLKIGTYTGAISFTGFASNSPRTIPVTLRIREPLPTSLRLSTPGIRFTAREGSTTPVAQTFQIGRVGEVASDWKVRLETLNGGDWLAATPSQGKDDGSVTVRANLGNLSAGVYAGRIHITSSSAANSPLMLPVTFEVTEPQISLISAGVLNAATGLAGPIAPGQLMTLRGERLGPQRFAAARMDDGSRRFPRQLGGATVTFDGTPAALLYAAYDQINLQAPFEIAGKRTVKMKVESLGTLPVELELPVVDAAPGLFTVETNRAAAFNADGSANRPENPAPVGTTIRLLLTGQGRLEPQLASGLAGPAEPPFPSPALQTSVLIGNSAAAVLSAVTLPDMLGVLQVTVEIPGDVVPSPNVPVQVGFPGVLTRNDVMISVSGPAPQP